MSIADKNIRVYRNKATLETAGGMFKINEDLFPQNIKIAALTDSDWIN